MRRLSRFALILTFFAVPATAVRAPSAQAHARPDEQPSPVTCRSRSIAGARYRVCVVAASGVARLRLVARGPRGRPVETIARADSIFRTQGERLLFATNAGLYEATDSATGMLVADGGRVYSRLNRGAGPPNPCAAANFYCPPNAVFFVARGRAAILATRAFAARPASAGRVELATQSGPMLVRGGRQARAFDRSEKHRKVRNGVGVRADGSVVFAIADDPVSFHSFAEAFRSELRCVDALFLDGSISQMYTGPGSRLPGSERQFAAIFAVTVPSR
jgi:uncharacterized protein YigE (DUF2233 family)